MPTAFVVTHGHCFDGLCSAVVFTRLAMAVHGRGTTFRYATQGYGGTPPELPALSANDVNALLDYRFYPSPALTWYFDHHPSAFPDATTLAAFQESCRPPPDLRAARPSSWGFPRYYHDPRAPSCAELIARVASLEFGVDLTALGPLIAAANRVDTAGFATAAEAVQPERPEDRLAAVVREHGDCRLLSALVPSLLERPLAEVAGRSELKRKYHRLARSRQQTLKLVQVHAVVTGNVVLTDLLGLPLPMSTQFMTYALFPDSMYSVSLTQLTSGIRLSLGFNPWCGQVRRHDLGALCQRFGGGGHPVVGAAHFAASPDGPAEARRIARTLVLELQA